MQSSSDGMQTEIRGATSASYMLSVDDIGCFVSVSCEPVRSDCARGPTVLSEQIGPIIPGMQLIFGIIANYYYALIAFLFHCYFNNLSQISLVIQFSQVTLLGRYSL